MVTQLRFPFPQDRNDRFENFVTDLANSETVATCKNFLENSEEPKGLIIHGEESCGKTHLLSAMGSRLKEKGEDSVLYLDCCKLLHEVRTSSPYEELKDWLEKYEKATFLAVDNLEVISGVPEAEEQVFHLYNFVTNGGGKFTAAINTSPNSWNFIPDLKSRLLWGHVVALKPVGDDNRGKVLTKMASDMGLTLPDKGADWLLTHFSRNPAKQKEALVMIDGQSLDKGRKVTIQLIKEVLGIT